MIWFDNACLESQCKVAIFGEIHSSLIFFAISCPTRRLDLSAVEYDIKTFVQSPPASDIKAFVYIACCDGVIFKRVANATSFGLRTMS